MQLIKRHRNLVPLLILTYFEIETVLAWASPALLNRDGYLLVETSHVLAFMAVVICWLFFFTDRQLFHYALLLTLGLGTFCVLDFTPSISSINFSGHRIFQPLSLALAILTLIINAGKLKSNTTSHTIVIDPMIKEEEIQKFVNLYKDKTTASLQETVSDSKFSDLAKEAAARVLRERVANEGKI